MFKPSTPCTRVEPFAIEKEAQGLRSASPEQTARPVLSPHREQCIVIEGVIAKRKGSPYQPGECSGDWVKLKLKRQKMRAAELRPAESEQAIDGTRE